MSRRDFTALSIAIAGDEPPDAFRIFVAGWNDTEKGRFLFDEAAAASVMAAYEAHGVDRMIDLEHLSLDSESASYDPDARGWCKLELRSGELWAAGVSWTPDGVTRLTNKTQRYISPAFAADPKTKRVTKIVNIALTALPATHHTPELVAASARDLRKLSTGPAFADVQSALNAALAAKFPSADPMACTGPRVVDVFDATMVYQLDGKLFEVPYTFDGSTATLGAPAEVARSYKPIAAPPMPVATNNRRSAVKLAGAGEKMDPKLIGEALDALIAGDAAKCQEILKGLVASAAGAAATPAPAEGDPATTTTDPATGDKQEEIAAALSVVQTLSGKKSIVASVADIRTWHASHVELATEKQKLADREAVLESAERRKLCAELVTLGAEFPSTVWADDKATTLKPRWLKMDLVELRAHSAEQRAARGGKAPAAPRTPAGSDGYGDGDGSKDFQTPDGLVTLSASELRECERAGAKPEVYAANKARRQKK